MGLFPVGYTVGDHVAFNDFYIKNGKGCRCIGLAVGAPESFRDQTDDPGPLIRVTDAVLVKFGEIEERHSSELFDRLEPLEAIVRLINQGVCLRHNYRL